MTNVKSVNIEIDVQDPNPGIISLVAQIRPSWNKDTLKFKTFTDGISNILIGVRQAEDKSWKEMVLVRIYGRNTELLIDRNTELGYMELLHAAGMGPPVLARFSNGIAYGFIVGQCLDDNTVRDPHIGSLIAREIVRLHSVDPHNVLGAERAKALGINKEPCLFKKLRQWISVMPDNLSDPAKNERYKKDVRSRDELNSELDELEKHLVALNSPIVLSHNDLLLNNIVYNKESDTVHFIDFEYAGFNYEAFDIADHFDEYAGVDSVDFSRYPGKDHQLRWLRKFLEHKNTQKGKAGVQVSDRDVEAMFVAVNKFALAGHFFWGVWGVVQAANSAIDFDFLGYAIMKFGEYFNRKEEFLALELPQ